MNRVHKMDYRVIRAILQSIDSPRSLGVLLLLENGQFSDILDLKFEPLWFNSYRDAADCLLATELLSKFDGFSTGANRKIVAMEKFHLAEERCKETNDIWLRREFTPADSSLIHKVGTKMSNILGPLPLEDIVEDSGWGPGVTLFNKGTTATHFNKFRNKCELTVPLYALLSKSFNSLYPSWNPVFKQVEGNKIITVPKNSKTDRVIAVEPSLNLWFQKGVGSAIRKRLYRKCGIDLCNQGVNQRLADSGSCDGMLCTVDFSAASDTISYVPVMDVTPFEWFHLLDMLRSPRGVIPGCDNFVEYAKFSSMGNGYTFELESLLFFCIAQACCPEDHPLYHSISIYGDDLIIPSDCYGSLVQACKLFGFTINEKKSFYFSPYRESCGKHYWGGVDITPFYLRRSVASHFSEFYKIHNAVMRYSCQNFGWGRDRRFKPAVSDIVGLCPKEKSLRVPLTLGDCGFAAEFDEACPPRSRRYQSGYNITTFQFVSDQREADGHEVLLTRLWSRSIDSAKENTESIPRRGRWLRKKSFVPAWFSMGPWNSRF